MSAPNGLERSRVATGRRERITVVADADGNGGAEAVLASLAVGWRDRFDVTAVVPARNSPLIEQMSISGATVSTVHGFGRHCTPAGWRGLRAALERSRPDCVVLNLTDQGDGAAMVWNARRIGVRTVALLHLWIPGRSRVLDALSARRLNMVDAIGTPSEATAALVHDHGLTATSVQVAPQRMPTLQRQQARDRLGLAGDGLTIGGIGRLAKHKGWDVLVSAAAIVHETRPDVTIAVVGDGPKRDQLRSLDRAGDIMWIGRVDQAARAVSAFDLVVMPSRYEGLPLVAIEAAYAGVPVVATDVTGLREAIGDEGWLVPPNDSEALAAALLSAVNNPDALRRRGEDAAARAESLFTVQGMVDRVDALVWPRGHAEVRT